MKQYEGRHFLFKYEFQDSEFAQSVYFVTQKNVISYASIWNLLFPPATFHGLDRIFVHCKLLFP